MQKKHSSTEQTDPSRYTHAHPQPTHSHTICILWCVTWGPVWGWQQQQRERERMVLHLQGTHLSLSLPVCRRVLHWLPYTNICVVLCVSCLMILCSKCLSVRCQALKEHSERSKPDYFVEWETFIRSHDRITHFGWPLKKYKWTALIIYAKLMLSFMEFLFVRCDEQQSYVLLQRLR